MGKVFLGCSGWSYKEWEGVFYPERSKGGKLSYYSRVFDTAEVDSTFYSLPPKGMVYGWARVTPKEFSFSVKLPQTITHEKVLSLERGVEEELKSFVDLMKPLKDAGKLAALLIQLPPSFKKDYHVLEEFLACLPSTHRFACEFRHTSWWREETWSLLRRYNVANVIVDEPLLPPDVILTTDFAFIRWHGRGKRPWYNYLYDTEELLPWAQRLGEASSKTIEVYGYFNNHFHGYAVENSLEMLKLLDSIDPNQAEVLHKIKGQLEQVKTPSIMTFDTTSPDLDHMLLLFLDKGRLNKAKSMGEDEISVRKDDGSIEAKVRGHAVRVSLQRRSISHHCPDWEDRASRKLFCKHIAKTLMEFPDEAIAILQDLMRNSRSWSFSLEVPSSNQ